MSAVVLPFFDQALLNAYRALRRRDLQPGLQLELATSLLIEAIRRGRPVPTDTIGRLAALAARGPGHPEFRRRLAAALVEIQEVREPVQPEGRSERGAKL